MDENQNRKVKTAKGHKRSNENNLIGSPIPTRYSRELTHSALNESCNKSKKQKSEKNSTK